MSVSVGNQYRTENHTVTFARSFSVGDPVTVGLFTEIDGAKPKKNDRLPEEILRLMTRIASD